MLRLRELRLENEQTQSDIANAIGVSRQVYSNYENEINQPSIEILIKLSKIFQCSVDYLIGFSDDFGNVTVYQQTDGINSLTAEEQKIIDALRRNTSINAGDFLAMYADLPLYMQESIFAELKGMHLGYTVSKKKKQKENL